MYISFHNYGCAEYVWFHCPINTDCINSLSPPVSFPKGMLCVEVWKDSHKLLEVNCI